MTAPLTGRSGSLSSPSLALLTPTVTQPPLEELKLCHILDGETCPPISFPDLAAFVTNRDFTSENLLFVVWFRNYRARHDALKPEIKARIPIPSTRLGDRYDPFGYLDRGLANQKNGIVVEEVEEGNFQGPFRKSSVVDWKQANEQAASTNRSKPCGCGSHSLCGSAGRNRPRLFPSLSRTSTKVSGPGSCNPHTIRPTLQPSMYPPLPPPGTEFLPPTSQPMREEAQRAFATFLRKGGSRELGISDELREFARTGLKRSTAPCIFLPIYEEIYTTVERQSLPRFLESAKVNINRPKVLFWYMVGFIDFMIGLTIYLLLTLLLPRHPVGLRAYRLFSLIFVPLGVAQAYSAYRGFCSQVWGRSHRQVQPWEMDGLDDEETLVECDGREAEIEAKGGMGTGSDSVGDHTTGKTHVDYTLPMEVHPLSDFGGTTDYGFDNDDKPGSPSSSNNDATLPTIPVLEGEMTEVQRRQHEIRLTTVKVPCPKEAFPIDDREVPHSPKPSSDGRQRRDISPFAMDGVPSEPDSTSGARPFSVADLMRTQSKAAVEDTPAQRTSRDLSTLLKRLRRTAPFVTENQIAPAGRRGSETSQYQREKKAKVFGPEALVEDPRIQKVYRDIKRDILFVGFTVMAIWLVLCLAVPCAGLA
ncbi:hypothetical protein CI109_101020 [Kwoniella shandongensis]|uniref:Uncharacterized protein n=1 Tax=Kwoniella shandongensis TaxID=1734106 RepID=A0A5M6C9K4_9TREE|nr:uncharacterized protein CI109_001489 [Kwoniella shandongensis]KAA5530085.1 hypothetical protein CI109_001489 [Kwoniella shandongensis]